MVNTCEYHLFAQRVQAPHMYGLGFGSKGFVNYRFLNSANVSEVVGPFGSVGDDTGTSRYFEKVPCGDT